MQPNIVFNAQQVKALESALSRQLEKAKRIGGLTLEHEAEVIMSRSWEQIPVETGAAMSTGFVKPSKDDNGDPTVKIGYEAGPGDINPKTGRPVEDYLYPLHEDLDRYHARGKAKFLEDPLLAYIPTLRTRLTNIIQYQMKYNVSPAGLFTTISSGGD